MVFDKYLCVFFVGCFFVDSVVKKNAIIRGASAEVETAGTTENSEGMHTEFSENEFVYLN